jgi:hypothetical protein
VRRDFDPSWFPPVPDGQVPVQEVADALASALLGLDDDRTVALVVRTADGRDVRPTRAVYDPVRGTLTLVVEAPHRATWVAPTGRFPVEYDPPWVPGLDAARRAHLRRVYGLDPAHAGPPTDATPAGDPLVGLDLRIVPAEDAGEPPPGGAGDR